MSGSGLQSSYLQAAAVVVLGLKPMVMVVKSCCCCTTVCKLWLFGQAQTMRSAVEVCWMNDTIASSALLSHKCLGVSGSVSLGKYDKQNHDGENIYSSSLVTLHESSVDV